jgi:hypothetical protein
MDIILRRRINGPNSLFFDTRSASGTSKRRGPVFGVLNADRDRFRRPEIRDFLPFIVFELTKPIMKHGDCPADYTG